MTSPDLQSTLDAIDRNQIRIQLTTGAIMLAGLAVYLSGYVLLGYLIMGIACAGFLLPTAASVAIAIRIFRKRRARRRIDPRRSR
jgi:hypothetical protein